MSSGNEKRTSEGALKIRLLVDTSSLDAAMDELKTYLDSPSNAFLKIIEGFLGGINSLSEIVSFNTDNSPTSSAGDVRVLLEPSDSFGELLAALRASELHGMRI